MSAHLPILPLLAPFLAALLLLAWPDLSMARRRAVALWSAFCQVGLALWLLVAVADGAHLVYRLGDWPPPWGVVLVADRLAAGMVLITTLLALVALLHVGDGTDRRGRHFHVLFQFQLFGLSGAFLTGDLFNLFVFFEVLLIASYGLLLHGGGAARVAAGLHYVVLNLLGSAVFLIAAGLLYGALGTLNMADLALRASAVAPENLGLARSGGLLLFVAFALKAALVPLHLWLPAAYAGTAAPVAALFAVMTKLGAYAILRGDSLFFGSVSGPLAGLYAPWLLPLGLFTLLAGSIGALAAASLGRLAAYLVVASAGTLLIAWSLGPAGVAAGLYYLPHGTFAAAALFLVAEAVRRRRASADRLVVDADLPRHGLWGAFFFVAAVAAAGLPPLSGFVGKFLLLRAADASPLIWGALLLAAFFAVLALARAGSRLFLAVRSEGEAPELQRSGDAVEPPPIAVTAIVPEAPPHFTREAGAVASLLFLIGLLTVGAGPASDYARATATQLADPAAYIAAVLGGGR